MGKYLWWLFNGESEKTFDFVHICAPHSDATASSLAYCFICSGTSDMFPSFFHWQVKKLCFHIELTSCNNILAKLFAQKKNKVFLWQRLMAMYCLHLWPTSKYKCTNPCYYWTSNVNFFISVPRKHTEMSII